MTTEVAVRVESPKGLSEEAAAQLRKKMQAADKLLTKGVRPAIEAWAWALQHGFKGYRATLKAADVEPSGHWQRCYDVARAMVATETSYDDLAEVAGSDRLTDLATAAKQMLTDAGLTATKGKVRTPLETAARVVDVIVKVIENLEKPASGRAKSNPGLPKPADVPSFNVRECVENALAGRQVNIVLLADVPAQAVPAMAEAAVDGRQQQ